MREALLAGTALISMIAFRPILLLIHEAGHARAAERETSGPVEIRVGSAGREIQATLLRRAMGLTRTAVWVGLGGRGGGTLHDGPETTEQWIKILRARSSRCGSWPLRRC